jgi:hypothetical protein
MEYKGNYYRANTAGYQHGQTAQSRPGRDIEFMKP